MLMILGVIRYSQYPVGHECAVQWLAMVTREVKTTGEVLHGVAAALESAGTIASSRRKEGEAEAEARGWAALQFRAQLRKVGAAKYVHTCIKKGIRVTIASIGCGAVPAEGGPARNSRLGARPVPGSDAAMTVRLRSSSCGTSFT